MPLRRLFVREPGAPILLELMALVAGLIALEKLLPWRRTATWSVTAVLLLLAVLLAFAPDAVPGLTIPGGSMS